MPRAREATVPRFISEASARAVLVAALACGGCSGAVPVTPPAPGAGDATARVRGVRGVRVGLDLGLDLRVLHAASASRRGRPLRRGQVARLRARQ